VEAESGLEVGGEDSGQQSKISSDSNCDAPNERRKKMGDRYADLGWCCSDIGWVAIMQRRDDDCTQTRKTP
jgi:hypothetical protein